jgi:hypothetical protein
MKISYFLFWLPMIMLAFANAALRQMVFLRFMSEHQAQQLSTLTLTLLCAVYVAFIFPKLQIQSAPQALGLGLLWMLLTTLFEFGLGRFSGKTWAELFANYNLLNGQLWPLFLLCLGLMPWAFFIMRR